MKGYIYETTNLINGKKYIGKHISNKFDNNYYGSGVALKRAINKYNKENFRVVILEEVEDLALLSKLETDYIIKFNAVKDNNYYNNSYGGEDEGWSGINKMYKEKPDLWRRSREKSSKSQTGQKRTLETKTKISNSLKGRIFSEEHRKNISEAAKKRLSMLNKEERYKIGLNFGTLGKSSLIKGRTKYNSEQVRKATESMVRTKNSKEWKETIGKDTAKKISQTRKERCLAKGKNNPMYGTKTVYVSNIKLDIVKRVKIEELDNYIKLGWLKCNIHKMKK